MNKNNPQYIGAAALCDYNDTHCAIVRSDLLINVGPDVVNPPFFTDLGGTDDESFPVKPQRFVADVRKVMPFDGSLSKTLPLQTAEKAEPMLKTASSLFKDRDRLDAIRRQIVWLWLKL